MGRHETVAQPILEAIKANTALDNPLPLTQLAKVGGWNRGTVYSIAQRYGLLEKYRAGRMKPTIRDEEMRVARKEAVAEAALRIAQARKTRAEMLEQKYRTKLDEENRLARGMKLVELEGLTPDERRRVLSEVAVKGSDNSRVQAVRAMEEMDRATGVVVGPPDPVSEAEVVERLGRLLGSFDEGVLSRALEVGRRMRDTLRVELESAGEPSLAGDDVEQGA